MKELAQAQNRASSYAAVGIGIIADRAWPSLCRSELQSLGLPQYLASTPKVFGTAQFLWQRVHRPPLHKWVDQLLASSGAKRCIVHFHNAWLSGVFLPLASELRGRVRVVATFHGVNAHFHRQLIRQCIHRWMASRLVTHRAKLTSVDRGNLPRAERLLNLDPEKFTIIPNGIADTQARGCPHLNGASTLTVGHVGSIVSQKGWRVLVEAVQRLRTGGCDINVILAGRGEDAEEACLLAKNSGGWLKYEGFVADPRESVMTRLDALVLMSEQEGLPMAIIEALSVGVPVIATAVGGVPEAVIDGKNGLLIPRSVPALAQALERLVQNRELQKAMRLQARQQFENNFEISRIVSRYHALYEERI